MVRRLLLLGLTAAAISVGLARAGDEESPRCRLPDPSPSAGRVRNVYDTEPRPGTIGWQLQQMAAARPTWAVVGSAAAADWGPVIRLPGRTGSARYWIRLEPVGPGDKEVVGRVTYIGLQGRETTREFVGSVRIATVNAAVRPEVELFGVGASTAVRIIVQ